MINLAPDMWLTPMQDETEDDVHEYGRLVIDISDPPDNADNVKEKETDSTTNGYTNIELRGDLPTPITENETSSPTRNMQKPYWDLNQKEPLRLNRDIPIKLLLKRSFQINRNKPHKKRLKEYDTSVGEKPEYENNHKELLPNHENNTKETVQNQTTNTTAPSEKPNTLKQSIVTHIEELISTRKQYLKKLETQVKNTEQILTYNVNERFSPQNNMNNTEFLSLEKQHTLANTIRSAKEKESSNKLNQYQLSITKTGLHPIPNFASYKAKDYSKNLFSVGSPHNKYHLNQCVDPAIITTHKHYLNQVEQKTRNERYTVDSPLNAVIPTHLENTATEKQNSLKRTIKSHRDHSVSTHKPYLNQEETQRRTDIISVNDNQRVSPPNSKENNDKTTKFDSRHSITPDQGYHSPELENRQRISVVSNDFLFKHRTRGRPRTNYQSRRTSDQRHCPQLYQEALMDFMEQRYQIALRENIPLTVNRKPLNQDPFEDTRFTEVFHISQSTNPEQNKISPPSQQRSNFSNQHHHESTKKYISKDTPVVAQNPPSSEKQPGYNILVHKGPDINRIVITIADEKEEKNNAPDQSFSGDQRVPDSITNVPYPEASPPIHRKRSYYYKEPSLRSFRKRLPLPRTQRQSRNAFENNRYEPMDRLSNYPNEAFALNYCYPNHYEIPTPVIDNDYASGAQEYIAPVGPISRPWEGNERPVVSDRITRRAISSKAYEESSKKQYHLDAYERPMHLGPLNLSLKPHERPHPEMYPNYPLTVQDYY